MRDKVCLHWVSEGHLRQDAAEAFECQKDTWGVSACEHVTLVAAIGEDNLMMIAEIYFEGFWIIKEEKVFFCISRLRIICYTINALSHA